MNKNQRKSRQSIGLPFVCVLSLCRFRRCGEFEAHSAVGLGDLGRITVTRGQGCFSVGSVDRVGIHTVLCVDIARLCEIEQGVAQCRRYTAVRQIIRIDAGTVTVAPDAQPRIAVVEYSFMMIVR